MKFQFTYETISPNQLTVKLLMRARKELKDNPECYAFFVLTLGAGLRVAEVPLVRWKDFRNDSLEILSTNPEGSARTIPLDSEIVEEIKDLRPDGANPNEYIVTCVSSTHALRKKRHLPICREAHRKLSRWLRRQGLPPEPIALLRKLYGFKVLSGNGPDSFKRAVAYLGLGEERG